MALQKLAPVGGPVGCMGGKCPTIYRAEDGSIIIQGYKVDDEVRGSVSPADNEDIVRIPAELLANLKLQL